MVVITHLDLFIKDMDFSRESVWDNFGGFLAFNVVFAVPISVLGYFWWHLEWFRDLFTHKVPMWVQIFYQSYRVAGFVYLYVWAKDIVPNFAMVSVGFCDAFISITAIPLALYVRKYGLKSAKNFSTFWTIVGVYDITAAFILFILNFFGIYAPDTSMALFMLYPVSMIVFFNVEWIIFTHLLFLLQFDALMETKVNQALHERTSDGYTTIE